MVWWALCVLCLRVCRYLCMMKSGGGLRVPTQQPCTVDWRRPPAADPAFPVVRWLVAARSVLRTTFIAVILGCAPLGCTATVCPVGKATSSLSDVGLTTELLLQCYLPCGGNATKALDCRSATELCVIWLCCPTALCCPRRHAVMFACCGSTCRSGG